MRLTAVYQLFQGHHFQMAGYVNDQNLPGIFTILNSLLFLNGILYIIFILSYFSFLLTSKISLKENGWLFIITMIIAVTLPFEIYLLSIDAKIYSIVAMQNFKVDEVFNLYIKRMNSLSSFPVIELFCYGAAIFLLLFKPLRKKTN